MNNIEKAVNDLNEMKFVIINDKERENEADLMIAAQYATTEDLIFLMRYTSGIICVPMSSSYANELGLELMTKNPTRKEGCNNTVSVDSLYAESGISAYDKRLVIQHLVNKYKEGIAIPGHTYPLIAKDGGLSERRGHTEASLCLIELAGIESKLSVISELMDHEKGIPLRDKDLINFAEGYNITMVDIKEIMEYKNEYSNKRKIREVL